MGGILYQAVLALQQGGNPLVVCCQDVLKKKSWVTWQNCNVDRSRWNHYRFAKIFSIRNHVKSKKYHGWLVQVHKDKLGGPSSNIPNWKNMDPEMTAWRAVYAFCNLNGFSTNCLVSCYLKWTISYRMWVSSRSEEIYIYILVKDKNIINRLGWLKHVWVPWIGRIFVHHQYPSFGPQTDIQQFL